MWPGGRCGLIRTDQGRYSEQQSDESPPGHPRRAADRCRPGDLTGGGKAIVKTDGVRSVVRRTGRAGRDAHAGRVRRRNGRRDQPGHPPRRPRRPPPPRRATVDRRPQATHPARAGRRDRALGGSRRHRAREHIDGRPARERPPQRRHLDERRGRLQPGPPRRAGPRQGRTDRHNRVGRAATHGGPFEAQQSAARTIYLMRDKSPIVNPAHESDPELSNPEGDPQWT